MNIAEAKKLDQSDKIASFKNEFQLPKDQDGKPVLYFAGHSLGPLPLKSKEYVNECMEDWGKYGVEGHFEGKSPWLPYHEFLTEDSAKLVGAKPEEVVVMNSLTVNLHLMLTSFYRPTKSRYKILIENNTFPSDRYAALSQARFHGFDPNESVIELKPKEGSYTVSEDEIEEQILKHKDELALILLGNVNYLSGQYFDIEQITKLAHSIDCPVGFNLAHGAGNLELKLHDWNVDFAVWCGYKYLNSGPGGLAGTFVHTNHLGKKDIPRFEGWWGQNKETRFQMGPDFDPIPTVEAWQLSNPPILPMASLRASLEIFHRAGFENIISKRKQMTSYLEELLINKLRSTIQIITPQKRGAMLSLKFGADPKRLLQIFREKNIICDFREPDILRIAPAPLYTSYEDVFHLVSSIAEAVNE